MLFKKIPNVFLSFPKHLCPILIPGGTYSGKEVS